MQVLPYVGEVLGILALGFVWGFWVFQLTEPDVRMRDIGSFLVWCVTGGKVLL